MVLDFTLMGPGEVYFLFRSVFLIHPAGAPRSPFQPRTSFRKPVKFSVFSCFSQKCPFQFFTFLFAGRAPIMWMSRPYSPASTVSPRYPLSRTLYVSRSPDPHCFLPSLALWHPTHLWSSPFKILSFQTHFLCLLFRRA